MNRYLIILLFAAQAGLLAQEQAISHTAVATPLATSLAGALRTEDGVPLGGAWVRYQRVPKLLPTVPGSSKRIQLAPGETMESGYVTSNADGSFQIPQLSAGEYHICIDHPQGGILDPCRWASNTPVKTTLAAAVPSSMSFSIKRGGILRIRVNDPDHHLFPLSLDANRAPKFILGVRTSRQEFFAANMVGVDVGGLDYLVTVPFSEQVTLWLFSSELQFKDDTGTLLDVRTGTRKPYTIPAGVPELKLALSVSGLLQ